jgi:hypothetical protein
MRIDSRARFLLSVFAIMPFSGFSARSYHFQTDRNMDEVPTHFVDFQLNEEALLFQE